MAKVLDVAKYIAEYYKKISNEDIDEMKLHKLLYFSQREHLAVLNTPLFEEEMEGWKLGPVSRLVHDNFNNKMLIAGNSKNISEEDKNIINNVVYQYGGIASWKLSQMSHNEISWLNSRKGLQNYENGNNPIKLEDIKKDSEKVRPYDSTWGMYYDEFEDSMVALV